jgi:c(7)-type cytochrome triheme protein
MIRLVCAVLVASFIGIFAQRDTIIIKHEKVFKALQRTPVVFPHALHIGAMDCTACHHRYEKGKNVLDPAELSEDHPPDCGACHAHRERPSLTKAFHRQCVECHVKTDKEKKKSGPRMCAQCHPAAQLK